MIYRSLNCVQVYMYNVFVVTLISFFIPDMLNIPQATKPSSEIHVVFPHRIGEQTLHVQMYSTLYMYITLFTCTCNVLHRIPGKLQLKFLGIVILH